MKYLYRRDTKIVIFIDCIRIRRVKRLYVNCDEINVFPKRTLYTNCDEIIDTVLWIPALLRPARSRNI